MKDNSVNVVYIYAQLYLSLYEIFDAIAICNYSMYIALY